MAPTWLRRCLNRPDPIRYTGRLDQRQLATELEDGSTAVITDTNRRTALSVNPNSRPTLPLNSDQRSADLFPGPDTQSVATYGDASDIAEVGAGSLRDPGPDHRPSSAFDRDPLTSWLTGAGVAGGGQALEVTLNKPHEISSIDLTAAIDPDATREVSQVRLELSDGNRYNFDFTDGRAHATFSPQTVSRFRVVITRVTGSGLSPFGLSEVTIPGLDLQESIQVPTDLVDAAANDQALSAALANARLAYRFQRLQGYATDQEIQVHRRFETPDARSFDISGSIEATVLTADDTLVGGLNAPTLAWGSSRYLGQLASSGIFTADGDPATAWQAQASSDPNLHMQFPAQRLESVDLTIDQSAAPIPRGAGPGRGSGDDGRRRAREVPGRNLTLPHKGSRPDSTHRGHECSSEVRGESPNLTRPDPGRRGGNQRRRQRPPARLGQFIMSKRSPRGRHHASSRGPVGQYGRTCWAGKSIAVRSCGPEGLASGWHSLNGTSRLALDAVRLQSAGLGGVAAGPSPEVQVGGRSSTHMNVRLTGGGDVRLISGAAFAPGWQATSGGTSLGRPEELDVLSGWPVAASSDPTDVTITYKPQRSFTASIWISLLGVLLCLVLAFVNPQRRRRRERTSLRLRPVVVQVGVLTALTGFGYGAGGRTGLVFAFLIGIALWRRWVGPRSVAIGAIFLLALGVLAYFPPLGPAMQPLGVTWVSRRALAESFGRLLAVILATLVAAPGLTWRRTGQAKSKPTSRSSPPGHDEAIASIIP